MKSMWNAEAMKIASAMWKAGRSGGQILEAINHLAPGLTRAAITAKMKRLHGAGVGGRVVPASLSRSVKRPEKKVRETVPFTPIPLTEAGPFQCHRVIGEVVWRGVSTVCGRPHNNSNWFCDSCLEEMGMKNG